MGQGFERRLEIRVLQLALAAEHGADLHVEVGVGLGQFQLLVFSRKIFFNKLTRIVVKR